VRISRALLLLNIVVACVGLGFGQTASEFQVPIRRYFPVKLEFGDSNPNYGDKLHVGEDISAPAGTVVVAAGTGKVVFARQYKSCPNWGYVLLIEHTLADGSKVFSIYGHLEKKSVTVAENQIVERGTVLGQVGRYPCWGDHLHFGIHIGGIAQTGQYPSWLTGYLPVSAFPNGYVRPSDFIQAHGIPALFISSDRCSGALSCAGPQGNTFTFDGVGFAANAPVRRWIEGPIGPTELTPDLSADVNGQITWSFASSCSTQPNTYFIRTVDINTGKASNTVTEVITPGFCVPPTLPPPGISIIETAAPNPVTGGGTVTYTISVQNASGVQDAQNVIITDPLQGGLSYLSCTVSLGSCSNSGGTPTATIGILAAGASATFTLTALAPQVSTSTTIPNVGSANYAGGGVATTPVAIVVNPATPTNQQTWTQKFPATNPPPMSGAVMAYDAAQAQVVLFGQTCNISCVSATWTWDGTNWTQKFPVTSPSLQFGTAMAYDAAHGVVVLFGGFGDAPIDSATWSWDGTNWTQRFPINSPPGRYDHAIEYDPARGQVVLFGGTILSPQTISFANDTWVWDGTNWTEELPLNIPPGKAGHSMTYDSAQGQIVVSGGANSNPFETWLWDGTNWSQKFTVNNPPARFFHTTGFDAAHGRVVLFGGTSIFSSLLGDTWTWDGTNWTQESSGSSPPPRTRQAMAYDAARGQIVLFGGFSTAFSSVPDLNDTWVWPAP
jgi:uncharacterized repeat protein (TIGR01451 family)